MLVNIHLPKNAGTTLRVVLQQNFGDQLAVLDWRDAAGMTEEHNALFAAPASGRLCEQRLMEQQRAGRLAVSGHHLRALPADIASRCDLQFMTFIRHPIDRLLSMYHYERKWCTLRPGDFEPDHRALRSFEGYIDALRSDVSGWNNWQCHGLVGAADAGGATAIERLREFFFVGVVEDWDRSLILLRHQLQDAAIHDDFNIDYVHTNAASRPTKSGTVVSKALREKLLEENREDVALYDYARDRLSAQWRTLPRRRSILLRHMMRRTALHVGRRVTITPSS